MITRLAEKIMEMNFATSGRTISEQNIEEKKQ